jgi:hypothetical protein
MIFNRLPPMLVPISWYRSLYFLFRRTSYSEKKHSMASSKLTPWSASLLLSKSYSKSDGWKRRQFTTMSLYLLETCFGPILRHSTRSGKQQTVRQFDLQPVPPAFWRCTHTPIHRRQRDHHSETSGRQSAGASPRHPLHALHRSPLPPLRRLLQMVTPRISGIPSRSDAAVC